MPENISIVPLESDSVTVRWSPSECAGSELDLENMTVSAEFGSLTFMGLKNCVKYTMTMKIAGMVGDEFSNEREAEFSTCQGKSTDILDTMNTNKQCEFTSSERVMVQEEEVEVTTGNETQFEVTKDSQTQTDQAFQANHTANTGYSTVLLHFQHKWFLCEVGGGKV